MKDRGLTAHDDRFRRGAEGGCFCWLLKDRGAVRPPGDPITLIEMRYLVELKDRGL